MLERKKKSEQKEPARDRILRCAIARFSTQSYESTGLRMIAKDAGVDVAWVHRSFGSKEKLFAECVRVAISANEVLLASDGDRFNRLFEQVVRNREPGELRPIDIFIRSLSSSEASTAIRDIAQSLVMPSFVETEGHEARVALVLSMLFGFSILRDVVGIDALTKAEPDDIKRLLIAASQAMNPGPTA
ncbi:TetR/AcrR family transcriptional regulator [Rhizobium sp. FY34]|uniref:TetR/AcrR family transcriptional regulator n=1 Tax=Rhizobium sp. FY34 TaxID=2562309 RepID=UPI0010C06EB1|nr:TetR/AcrR family transcriptional regulator [Rhizobium sp. FY34]